MKRIGILLLALTCWLVAAAAGPVTVKTLLELPGSKNQQIRSEGTLVFDSAGNLYGATTGYPVTTASVFELSPNADGTWTENVLWTASGATAPSNSIAGLLFDASGNLYGTSANGPIGASGFVYNGSGTVFKLTDNPDGSWSESNLFDFDCGYGCQPTGGVIFDQGGNLYGATTYGGAYNYGVVYQLRPNADGTWTESVLHTFTNGADGAYPGYGSLVFDSKGNLYGTSATGGQTGQVCYYESYATMGCGAAYQMSPQGDGAWSFQVIQTFTGGYDGGVPQSGFTIDAEGHLYSTTYQGGLYGAGVAFEPIPDLNGAWTEKIFASVSRRPRRRRQPYRRCDLR